MDSNVASPTLVVLALEETSPTTMPLLLLAALVLFLSATVLPNMPEMLIATSLASLPM
jgi:hypothetical protein